MHYDGTVPAPGGVAYRFRSSKCNWGFFSLFVPFTSQVEEGAIWDKLRALGFDLNFFPGSKK